MSTGTMTEIDMIMEVLPRRRLIMKWWILEEVYGHNWEQDRNVVKEWFRLTDIIEKCEELER